MPMSLTRRVLLCAAAVGSGAMVRPLDGLAQAQKKKLPPCEAARSFGDWRVKIWDTVGALRGAITLAGNQMDDAPKDQCAITKDYPGLYIAADPKGNAVYSFGFVCPNDLLSKQFDLGLQANDGKQLSDRLDAHLQPITNNSTTGVWLDATSLFSGQNGDTLRRGGQISLAAKGDGHAVMAMNFNATGFAEAWQFFTTQFARLNAQRGKQCGDCFITTACCESFGLDDDCFELRTLRAFRDGPMRRMREGAADIARYYETAPFILRAMRTANDTQILTTVFAAYILPSALAAHFGWNSLARRLYVKMMHKLEARYHTAPVIPCFCPPTSLD